MRLKVIFAFLFSVQCGFCQDTIINPDYDYCREIKIEKDKFNGSVKKYSPELRAIQFIKRNQTVYMYITVWSPSYSTGEKGVSLLLTQGQRIDKKNESIKVEDYTDGYYAHSAFITLSAGDISKLKKYRITDYRLYVFDEKADAYDGEMYRRYLNCIVPNNQGTSTKKKNK